VDLTTNLRGVKAVLIAALTVALISCSWWSPRRVKLGERFTLRPKEKVAVADTELTIRLDEVGHQTFSGPGPPPGGASFVVLTVNHQSGSRSIRISVGDSAEAGDYAIKVNSAHPFRNDNGPNCELTVTSAKK
jgi:hypothetical protein